MKKTAFFIMLHLCLFYFSVQGVKYAYAAAMLVWDQKVHQEMIKLNTTMSAYTKNATSNFIKQSMELVSQSAFLKNQLASMTGNLKLYTNFGDRINDLMDASQRRTSSLVNKTLNDRILDNKLMSDIPYLLDGIFPSKTNPDSDVFTPYIDKYRSDAYKSALEESEYNINNASKNLKEIDEIVSKIDNTVNIKESLDVLIKMMGKLLVQQHQQTQILSQIARTSAAHKYEGYIPSAQQKIQSRVQEVRESFNLNSNINLFQIEEKKVPFLRRGRSTVDKVFLRRYGR